MSPAASPLFFITIFLHCCDVQTNFFPIVKQSTRPISCNLQSNFLKGDVSLKLVIMPLLYFKGFQISLFFQSMYVVFCFSLTYAGYKFVMTG